MELVYDDVLVNGSEDDLWEYAYDTDKSVVINRREEDDAIIGYFIAQVPEADLACEWTDDEDALVVTYNGKRTVLSLTFTARDRYVVIRGLNRILTRDYEIRVFRATLGRDSHAFLIKPKSWWAAMEEQFADRVRNVFAKITRDVDFA